MAKKKCTKCGDEKPLKLFSLDRRKSDGRCSWCPQCVKDHYEEHKVEIAERMARHYKANRAKILARSNRYYKTPAGRRRSRDNQLRRAYGITLADYERIYEAQRGLCRICRKPETVKLRRKGQDLCVDHCHETGRIRGLLCRRCNRVLGLCKDDPKVFRAMIRYLRIT